MGSIPTEVKIFSLACVAHRFPLLGLTHSGLFMGWISTLIYTSELIGHVRYKYFNMVSSLSGQNCKFFKLLLYLNSRKKLGYKENNTKYRSLTWKPPSYVRILIYRTWPILCSTICIHSATRHNIHMYRYFLFVAIHYLNRPRLSLSEIVAQSVDISRLFFRPWNALFP